MNHLASSVLDILSSILGQAPSRDLYILISLAAGLGAFILVSRLHMRLTSEIKKVFELKHVKARLQELSIKHDDLTFKMNTDITKLTKSYSLIEKQLASIEEKLSQLEKNKSQQMFVLDDGEDLEDRIYLLEQKMGLSLGDANEAGSLSLEQDTASAENGASNDISTEKSEGENSERNTFRMLVLTLQQSRKHLQDALSALYKSKTKDITGFSEALQAILEANDLSSQNVNDLIQSFKQTGDNQEKEQTEPPALSSLTESLHQSLTQSFTSDSNAEIKPCKVGHQPKVIVVLGAEGSGKTMVAARMAMRFQELGAKVLFADCNTLGEDKERLVLWSEKAQIPIVIGAKRSKPSSVAYKALHKAQDDNCDVVIIDTPDALPHKQKLNAEVTKVLEMIDREQPNAPHEMLLVLDASLGDETHKHAKEFSSAAQLSGLIFTKLDRSDRAGIIVSIASELVLPVRYLSVGKSGNEFIPFSAIEFTQALISDSVDSGESTK